MAKLKNIIKQLSEEDFVAIYDSLIESSADKSAFLLRAMREKQQSDNKIMEELDVNTNAYYTLRSRLNQKIEGLGSSHSYEGKKVLLIEDLISTGGSSISAVKAIVEANGICPYTLAIFTYGLEASKVAFNSLDPKCEALTILDYDTMLKRAVEIKYINEEEATALREWREDPFNWGINRGFAKVE